MILETEIEDQRIEKHFLVILRPRVYLPADEWEDLGSGDYRYYFPYKLKTLYRLTSTNFVGNFVKFIETDGFVFDQTHYKFENDYIYVNDSSGLFINSFNPIGVTAEYELYLSDSDFTGNSDPIDSTGEVVDWLPYLTKAPLVQTGSRDNAFGFYPTIVSTLEFVNVDGWFNEHIIRRSYRNARCEGFIFTGSRLETAIEEETVFQVFNGFTSELSIAGESVSISCNDFLNILEDKFPVFDYLTNVSASFFDPNFLQNENRFARVIRGRVEAIVPVNISYSPTPATTTNRDWSVMNTEALSSGSLVGLAINHLGSNTATETFTVATPQVMPGDYINFLHSGTPYQALVTAVDRNLKKITHTSIGRGSVVNGDIYSRFNINRVEIEADGTKYTLIPYVHYEPFTYFSGAFYGFQLYDDFESLLSGFPTPFTPGTHKIRCTVYGTRDTQTHFDSTDVGGVVDNGGINASAYSVLYYLLSPVFDDTSLIDLDSFQNATTNHALGIAIPESVNGAQPTVRELVLKVLQSMNWKLGFREVGRKIKIGLIEEAPFTNATGDFDLERPISVRYQEDYSGMETSVRCVYNNYELLFNFEYNNFFWYPGPNQSFNRFIPSQHLHFVKNRVPYINILQYDPAEALEIANRIGTIFTQRRGFFELVMGPEFLKKIQLGGAVNVVRENLPGFTYQYGTLRSIQTRIIEVQKSTSGVTLTVEDQRGIQDREGDW